MKSWAYGLYVALFVAGVAASCFVGGPVSEVIVADRDLEPGRLCEIASRVGDASPIEPDGFMRVRARGTYQSAVRRLKDLGVDYVFEAGVRDLDSNSLASVRKHIAYHRAKKTLFTTGDKGEKGVDFFESLEFYLERRVESDGLLDPDRWLRAASHRDQMPKWRPSGKLGPSGQWEHLGPIGLDVPYREYYGTAPLSGRKNAVAYAPSNASRVYAVSAGSGIWRSDDGGSTWLPKSDGWPTMQANCIAVDPTDPDIIYVGTGDYKLGIFPNGLMKSTDGGDTWTNHAAALFGSSMIQKIVIDPANRDTLVLCTADGSTARGIWRSTDAGLNWTQVLSNAGSMNDLDLSVNDGGIDWWCVGGPGVPGGRIYKSSNGINWTLVPSPSTAIENRMDIACSKVDRNTVYLLATGAEKIYKTTNGGSTWTNVTNDHPSGTGQGLQNNYNWSQKTYDSYIGTTKDGNNDVVIVGLITLSASFNGGTSWFDIGKTWDAFARTHNDQHCMAVHPSDDGRLLIGNDGGVSLAILNPASGSATIVPLNDQISDEMFYTIALHPSDPTRIMGGTQDNATPASRGDMFSWKNLWAGDGGWCSFDPADPEIHYTSAQGLNIFRYHGDDDLEKEDITGTWGETTSFIAPVILAGNGSELFAASSSFLWKWNGGTSWTKRPTDLGGFGDVTYLAAAPSNGDVIYSGANSGEVWRTPDQGLTFTRIDAGIPNDPIGAITVSRTNPNEIYVSVGNSGMLYRCADTSAASPVWSDISGSGGMALPAVPISAIALDPNNPGTIYAGTDVGVFLSTDAGASWSNMTVHGLPNVMITDLEFNAAKTHLYAGTFGRGIWRVAIEPATHNLTGWVKQNGAAVPGATVRLMQGSTVIKTATPNASGIYTLGAPNGTYTIKPYHDDKVFFPASRDVVVTGPVASQNFTAGNIGPTSILWQYQNVVYSDQSRQGTLGLNVVTPVARDIQMFDNSFKLTSPIKVTVPAGQRTQTFFVYGVSVTADTLATVTATHQGLTSTAGITVRPKPILQTLTLAVGSVKGGIGVTGTAGIDKPAIGPMALYLTTNKPDVATITPSPTAIVHGASSKSFYCRTFPVTTNQVVTITGTFYGSTKTVNLTVTP